MMKVILNELSYAIFSYLSKFLSRYMLEPREKKILTQRSISFYQTYFKNKDKPKNHQNPTIGILTNRKYIHA